MTNKPNFNDFFFVNSFWLKLGETPDPATDTKN